MKRRILKKAVDNIKKILIEEKSEKKMIEKLEPLIHSVIVRRDIEEETNRYFEKEYNYDTHGKIKKQYRNTIKSLVFTKDIEVIDEHGWFFFLYPKKTGTSKKKNFKINYKKYFTFAPTKEKPIEILEKIKNFLKTIPLIYEKFYDMNYLHNGGFSMKIPSSLRHFMSTQDSFIFYYDDRHLGSMIEQGIKKIFKDNGIKMKRPSHRRTTGFDFRNLETNVGKSHSQLIASIITGLILKKKKKFMKKDDKILIAWLEMVIKRVSKWNAKIFLRKLKGKF